MHFVDARGILSARNGMNIYRGCTHGCIYCDSRSRCYGFTHPFENIEVKRNAPALLEQKLRSKRKKCMIGTGAMCDPYLHCEEELRLTRACLEIIDRYGFGVSVLTKSDRILRDLDLLGSIQEKSKAVAQMTPLLPFINDTKENLEGILEGCLEAGVKGILCFGMGLTLREGNREYFYQALDRHFPGLRREYQRRYGNAYELPSPRHRELQQIFDDTCAKAGILYRPEDIFAYLREFPENKGYTQLSLF